MLKDACYSEHPHYKGKRSRESWKSKGVHWGCPPLPDPFWTPSLRWPWLFRTTCESVVIVKERSGWERKSLSPTARWFWQLSYSNFHRVKDFSLKASLRSIREHELVLANTEVRTQPQSMTRAKPCPGYPDDISQLQPFKPTPPFRAGPAAEAPCLRSVTCLSCHALPLLL